MHIQLNEAIGQVIITNITGKIIKQLDITTNNTTLDISNFDNGIYFVRIGKTTQKLIKID